MFWPIQYYGMMREGKIIESINESVGMTAYSSEDSKQSRLMESKVCFMLDAGYLGEGKGQTPAQRLTPASAD